jgi:hypothetical protein
MPYAPITTLLSMREETFKDTRHPVDDDAVARLAWTLPDEAPDPLGMAFVKLRGLSRLRERMSRMTHLGRIALRRTA